MERTSFASVVGAAVVTSVLLGVPGIAEARVESFRWSHTDPGVSGFRLHWGTQPGSYPNSIELGKPSLESDGAYRADIEVPDELSVYVVMTAYDGTGESGYSNQKLRPGLPQSEPPGGESDPLPIDPTASWEEAFDGLATGTNLPGWVDTAGNNSMSESDSLFSVVDFGNDRVLSTNSSVTNIHSHYTSGDSGSWSNYELRGRMRISDAGGGIGVTAYSLYDSADVYYRLRRYSGVDFELAMHPGISCEDSGTGVSASPDTWYSFALRVEPSGGANLVRAKVWRQGDAEPSAWQATCTDGSANRPNSGTVGVWSMGSGVKYWDDLHVVPLSGGGGSSPPPPDPGSEPEPEPDPLGKPGRPAVVSP